ncbi:helix-turn-helix domain-containing protein [Sporosarcina sp. ACRSL]|uniref:helix-turn-helix domain-containing protein n=1 Tax=Sporosarcina sp. ACRSL TaxID=2918215 RepID=UPI001EF5F5BA|nr:helix-turn-helix transcriptional regulator [Sporosarcina sp. ACRSL]MCG7346403.1 helix-turn-helix domain-containing protein [Sporosarcina sp. ACRSL]
MIEGLGERIKQLRKGNKDTLKGLAEKINYDWSNLSKIERGKYGITAELLNDILEIYGVDPNDFFGNVLKAPETEASRSEKRFFIDGVETTEREIADAIRLIRYFRSKI